MPEHLTRAEVDERLEHLWMAPCEGLVRSYDQALRTCQMLAEWLALVRPLIATPPQPPMTLLELTAYIPVDKESAVAEMGAWLEGRS